MVNTRSNTNLGDRLSRHFYDLSAMTRHPSHADTIHRIEILERAANHKSNYFPTSGVDYHLCFTGYLKLVPPQERIKIIEDDYGKMQRMFFGEITPFKEIVTDLEELENVINSTRF